MNKKFKLEKVLELREKALEREKIKLADLQQKEKEAREEINTVIEDIKSKNDEMEQDKAKGLFDFIEMYNKYIAVRQNDLAACEAKLQAAVQEVNKQKEVLKKSLNDLKVMEKLKAKHLLDYAEYVKKQENMQIDEINISRGHSAE
ncbi:MAG: hypothetical protein SPF17_08680 [Candidatus Mucispirillum faecigallinarum]|nr:hypothetical protein [Candidatus Mucispirillum faecigallinarum]